MRVRDGDTYLYEVHFPEVLKRGRTEDVEDGDDVFVVKVPE